MSLLLHTLDAAHPAGQDAILDTDGTRVSYGALREMTAAMADTLGRNGVRAGDRVMLVAENCASFLVATRALSQLRAWTVPVNARHTDAELTALQRHCEARCLLFTSDRSQSAAAHAARFGADVALPLTCGDLRATPAVAAPLEPLQSDPADDVAALMYTTGTTNAPKGVMLTQSNLVWNARTSARLRDMVPEDTVLAALPGTHIFGFSSTMLAALWTGATLRCMARFSPEALLQALAEGTSVLPAVPQMYATLLGYLHRSGVTVRAPALRYISAGGAPLDPGLKARTEELFGLPLHNGYGLTECSPGVAATRPAAPRRDVSVGTPLEDVDVDIAEPDPSGVGELIISSPGVMRGYYRDPEATAQALIAPGTLRSGDLARLAPDGSLEIVGRAKELILRSGFNVYPPEVEAMLTHHDAVLQAAVVGRPTEGNEEVLAFVLARDATSETEIRDWLKSRLAGYKCPSRILLVDAFPTAPTGKILKHRLLAEFADRLKEPTESPET